MNEEDAALVQTARDLSQWAAVQVTVIDGILADTDRDPPTREQQRTLAHIQRETLVRLSQRDTLLDWAVERRAERARAPVSRRPWWARWLR